MAATLTIHPEGEFVVGTMIDQDGTMFVRLDLPDRRTGDRALLVFDLASFVTFGDWVAAIVSELIDEAQPG